MMKASHESDINVEVRIVRAANCLVGNYSSTEHRACMDQIHNGRLNRIFQVAGVKYPSPPCLSLLPVGRNPRPHLSLRPLVAKLTAQNVRRASSRAGDKMSNGWR
jgi:hypothetical protein